MKLNNEYRFGLAPTVNTPRSRFLMHKNVRTTFNAGELIPVYFNSDIYPGDTYKFKGTFVCRMSTPIHTPMDNAFIDIRAFFTPHRIVDPNFKKMMGENETGAWTQTTEYEVPKIAIFVNNTGAGTGADLQHKVRVGDLANYLGFPIGYPKAVSTPEQYTNLPEYRKQSAYTFLSYVKVWNDWYRDENFVPPLYLDPAGASLYLVDYASSRNWGKYTATDHRIPPKPAPVYKFKDIANSCLPEPQKGNPVTLPIGEYAPVIGNEMAMGFTDGTNNQGLIASAATGAGSQLAGFGTGAYGTAINTANTGTNAFTNYNSIGLTTDAAKSGVIADLSNAVAATINAQRMAFATQRILEQSARTGTRYCEIIKGFFNVDSPMSAVLQRPEYLGGVRVPLSMAQVVQTSSTDATSPQGNTAGFSLTVDSQHYFTKSFTEHGTLLLLACVRTEHSYSQGIPLMYNKKRKLDFYWPQLCFLGEQAMPNSFIYADGSSNDAEVFGYNERWVELRSEMNINTGYFSPDASGSLDVWHYGDDYSSLPVLSDTWRRETKDNIDRTLAVQSSTVHQFLFDSRWEIEKTAAISLRSIPGLLDHF